MFWFLQTPFMIAQNLTNIHLAAEQQSHNATPAVYFHKSAKYISNQLTLKLQTHDTLGYGQQPYWPDVI